MGADAPATPTGSGDAPASQTAAAFAEVERDPRFQTLRRRHRSFVFPVLAVCLVAYIVFVILGAYAHEFMATPLFGSVNVGIVLGIAAIILTFVVTMIYVAFANRQLDPIAAELRDELENEGIR